MSYTNLLYHVVYATKERAPLITNALKSILHEYLRSQEKHHQKMSFEEEFMALLKAHHIDFDEAHLWG